MAQGRPADEYPFCWAIYQWIPGQAYADERVRDERQAASDLALFVVVAIHQVSKETKERT